MSTKTVSPLRWQKRLKVLAKGARATGAQRPPDSHDTGTCRAPRRGGPSRQWRRCRRNASLRSCTAPVSRPRKERGEYPRDGRRRILITTWHQQGPAGCVRKLCAAARMALPLMLRGCRTAAGVAAYFDLITDEGRLFYGDSFHFGYFRDGSETLAQALDAHTDLVAEMAQLSGDQQVLDVGCSLGRRNAGERRAVRRRITALNVAGGVGQGRSGRRGASDGRPRQGRPWRRAAVRFSRRIRSIGSSA